MNKITYSYTQREAGTHTHMQILRNRIENSCYTDYEKSTARARCQQFKLMIEIVYLTRSFARVCLFVCYNGTLQF